MTVIDRYIFKITLGSFLASLLALTGVVWVTQALRDFDLLTTKGQSLLVFFSVTSLIIPSLLMIIAPVALFIAVIYTLNKLNSDSEIIVLSAGGVAPLRLLRPIGAMAIVAMLLTGFLTLYLMPWSFAKTRDLLNQVRADFVTHIARPGAFNLLAGGFVFHYRERGPDDELLGIFMQDRRNPDQVNTYIAEQGATVSSKSENFLLLRKGSIQREAAGSRDPAIVQFDQYAIDLSQFGAATDGSPLKPRERSTMALLFGDAKDPYVALYKGRFRAELHDRFLNPLFALVFAMIGFAALGQPRTTRQGRGVSIALAALATIVVRSVGFGTSALSQRYGWAVWLSYLLVAVVFAAAAAVAFKAPGSQRRWSMQSGAAVTAT